MSAGQYTTRPLSERLWMRPDGDRVVSGFSANWSDTISLLIREVYALQRRGMPDPVIEVDVRERDIRRDGELRADAVAASPAVVLAFESVHGPMMYRCDTYSGGRSQWRNGRSVQPLKPWQHNLRAIAMTLDALRAAARYGAIQSGEQYRGFLAIESGGGVVATGMTTELATRVVYEEANAEDRQGISLGVAYRVARARSHPDHNNGDRSRWDAVEQAGEVLRRNGLLS